MSQKSAIEAARLHSRNVTRHRKRTRELGISKTLSVTGKSLHRKKQFGRRAAAASEARPAARSCRTANWRSKHLPEKSSQHTSRGSIGERQARAHRRRVRRPRHRGQGRSHDTRAPAGGLGVSKSGFGEWRSRPESATDEKRQERLRRLIKAVIRPDSDGDGRTGYRPPRPRSWPARGVQWPARSRSASSCASWAWSPCQHSRTAAVHHRQSLGPIRTWSNRDFSAEMPGRKMVGDITLASDVARIGISRDGYGLRDPRTSAGRWAELQDAADRHGDVAAGISISPQQRYSTLTAGSTPRPSSPGTRGA